MKIQIKSIAGSLLFEGDFSCIADAVTAAVKSSADLRYADLSSANLRYANLRSANLRYADLRYADLRYADLSSANLRYANLSSANLRYADLRYADLRYADLRYADLSSANLRSADLRVIKHDFWAVLSAAPAEVQGLRAALVEGRVNGSSYEGDCACLVGTIANVQHKHYQELGLLKPDQNRPAERFFLCINKGDTPDKNQASKLAVEWLDEWYESITAAFGKLAEVKAAKKTPAAKGRVMWATWTSGGALNCCPGALRVSVEKPVAVIPCASAKAAREIVKQFADAQKAKEALKPKDYSKIRCKACKRGIHEVVVLDPCKGGHICRSCAALGLKGRDR